MRGGRLHVLGLQHVLGRGRLVVVAVGKAAAPMAAAAETALGSHLGTGLVVTAAPPVRRGRLPVQVAGHPLPDERGLDAAREVERLLGGLGARDLVLLLLSGGASALLPAPAAGLTLADKVQATELLLRAGAQIAEVNTVRKHLSRLKGGGLARQAAPARVATLALSDVVGDDLAVIGSGPSAPDPTTYADALAVLDRYRLRRRVPSAVLAHLRAGVRGARPETPKPGDPVFARVRTAVVGSNRLSLRAAAAEARALGWPTAVVTRSLTGEAREAAVRLVGRLAAARRPCCLLAGGETTVTVRGHGRGGRNQELAVAAAVPLATLAGPVMLATLATDGRDGPTDAAGGVADDTSLARACSLGLAPPAAFLADNDAQGFLAPLADLVVTGPTGTNVMDLVVLLAAGGTGL